MKTYSSNFRRRSLQRNCTPELDLDYLRISWTAIRLKLKAVHRFTSTATAVEEMTSLQEGKIGKGLKQFLTDEVVDKGKSKSPLILVDRKLCKTSSSHTLSVVLNALNQHHPLPKKWASTLRSAQLTCLEDSSGRVFVNSLVLCWKDWTRRISLL